MPDKTVTLKYKVDSSDLDALRQKLLDIARLQGQVGGSGGRGGGPGPSGGGGGGGSGPGGWGGGGGGPGAGGVWGGIASMINPGLGHGGPGMGMGLGAAGAAGAGFGAAGAYLGAYMSQPYQPEFFGGGYGRAFSRLADNDYAWGAIDKMGGFGNTQNRANEVERALGIDAFSHQYQTGNMAIRNQARGRMYDIGRPVSDARAAIQAQSEFTNRLAAPGGMDGFITNLPQLGVQNEQTGAARFAAAQSQVGVREAQLALQAQQGRTAEARAGLDEAGQRRQAAQQRYAEAQAAVDKTQGMSGTGSQRAVKRAEAEKVLLNASNSLDASVQNEKERQAQLEKEITAEQQKQQQLTERTLQSDQAALGVKKNKLDLVREEAAVGRAGAEQAGMMMTGQKEFLKASAQKMQASGWDALNPMEREALMGNSVTNEVARRKSAESGAGFAKELGDIVGVRAGDFKAREKERDALQGEITQEEQRIVQAAAQANLSNAEAIGKAMADLVKQAMETMLLELNNKLSRQQVAGFVNNAIAAVRN